MATIEAEAFFAREPRALPLYLAFEKQVLAAWPNVLIRVQKTQISFSERHGFACVSLPLRRRKDWPEVCVLVTFGLRYRLDSPRIAVATEPYPYRWTHHVVVSRVEEIDEELLGWIGEARAFSASKRR